MVRTRGVQKSSVTETGDPFVNHIQSFLVHDFGGDVGHAAEAFELHALQNQRACWGSPGGENAGIHEIEIPLDPAVYYDQCLRQRDRRLQFEFRVAAAPSAMAVGEVGVQEDQDRVTKMQLIVRVTIIDELR